MGLRSARIVDTSIHSTIKIKVLLIDLTKTYPNDQGRWTVSTLGISIQYSIIQYQTRKGYWMRV